MVGYDPYSQFELSTLDYTLAGTVSGVTCRAFCQPLDVLKIRFQLQVDPLRRNQGKYFGLWQATRMIVREEGVAALWKGHIPAQALSIIFGIVQFTTFEYLTKTSFTYLPPGLSGWAGNFVAGALSGCAATVTALPADVLRTRMIAQGSPRIYNGVFHAVVSMVQQEGVLSFYRGFIPTIIQIAPFTGLQFAFYRMSTSLVARLSARTDGGGGESADIGAIESLLCGSTAGTAAKVIVYPFDMLKKRLQVIGFEHARQSFGTVHRYGGLVHCTKTVLRHEGPLGMFKGLWPSVLKTAVASGVGFSFYEQACTFLRHYRLSRMADR